MPNLGTSSRSDPANPAMMRVTGPVPLTVGAACRGACSATSTGPVAGAGAAAAGVAAPRASSTTAPITSRPPSTCTHEIPNPNGSPISAVNTTIRLM